MAEQTSAIMGTAERHITSRAIQKHVSCLFQNRVFSMERKDLILTIFRRISKLKIQKSLIAPTFARGVTFTTVLLRIFQFLVTDFST